MESVAFALVLGMTASQSPSDLAQEIWIADANILTPYRLTLDPADVRERSSEGEFDLPRAREGGLNLAFLGMLVPGEHQERGDAREVAHRRIDEMVALVESSSDLVLVRTPEEARAAFERGSLAIALAIENGAATEESLENLGEFRRRGVSLITLVHSRPNAIGDSSYSPDRPFSGLSAFGREVVAEMNRLGMIIDVSHMSDEAFDQVVASSRAPVIASHSSCRRFTPGWERNLDDERIRKLAANDGVLFVTFGGSFLKQSLREAEQPVWDHVEGQGLGINSVRGRAEARAFRKEHSIAYATVGDVVDHIDHVVDLVGVGHVGLGSGFDGSGDSMPEALKDVSGYPNLIAELLRRGYSREDIERIAWRNLERVWGQVIALADPR